jgi:hypothetical protein
MLSTMATKRYIKKALKFAFSGFSLVFIGMLFFIVVHDPLTGESSVTAEYVKSMVF